MGNKCLKINGSFGHITNKINNFMPPNMKIINAYNYSDEPVCCICGKLIRFRCGSSAINDKIRKNKKGLTLKYRGMAFYKFNGKKYPVCFSCTKKVKFLYKQFIIGRMNKRIGKT